VDASWCNLNVSSTLTTTADAIYSPDQRAVIVRVNPTSVQPHFNLFSLDIALPVFVNVAPSLTVPPVPIGATQLSLQGVRGPLTLRLRPHNVTLVRGNGYLEVQSDLW
jgi:hypothetical protein